LIGLLFTCLTGCQKFLAEKPRQTLVVPQSVKDLQSLLDNTIVMNSSSASCFSEHESDNYYVTTATYQAFAAQSGNPIVQGAVQNYLWLDPGVPYASFWNQPYQNAIYYSNIVLDQLPKITLKAGDETTYKALRGSALFYRAFGFHCIAQLYCRPYAQQYANSPGIVLRTVPDLSAKSTRATVQETYDLIIHDLKEAVDLLPVTVAYPTRPSQTAAYAMLARVYLSMRDYTNAAAYADLALKQKNALLDYNTINPSAAIPIAKFNPEVLFHNMSPNTTLAVAGNANMDSTLYASYHANDLRKVVFFGDYGTNPKTYYFQGGYDGQVYELFDGLATDEVYLMRAECAARAGNKDSAMNDLNRLMVKRWENSVAYTPITATDGPDALAKVLLERRKELLWRGLRWMDIRRLNLEGANITLTRVVNGVTYTLAPNSKLSVMLLPYEEITRSGLEQNER